MIFLTKLLSVNGLLNSYLRKSEKPMHMNVAARHNFRRQILPVCRLECKLTYTGCCSRLLSIRFTVMKPRAWQVLALFVLFYYMVRLIQDMPNLVNGRAELIQMPDTIRAFLFRILHVIMLGSFALSTYLLLLKYYSSRPLLAITLIGVVNIVLFFLFFMFDEQAIRLRHFFINNLFYFFIYIAFGAIFFFIRFSAYKEVQRKDLLMQHRQAELSFLRSQLNPHFLFNSLNNIYSLVNQGSDKALDAIAGFSDLMRYMLYDASENIRLSDEISYIHKYIHLQQLRFDFDLPVNISVTGLTPGKTIPPLLLIPFVENAFKHGSFQSKADELIITIRNDESGLHFFCSNRVNNHQKDSQGGIGLENVKRRLELLYPSTHHLAVGMEQERFNVKLHLQND
jgi:two-component system, LytTR family, sensor kinase